MRFLGTVSARSGLLLILSPRGDRLEAISESGPGLQHGGPAEVHRRRLEPETSRKDADEKKSSEQTLPDRSEISTPAYRKERTNDKD